MAWEKLNSDRIEQIIRQITGKGLDKSVNMIAPAGLICWQYTQIILKR